MKLTNLSIQIRQRSAWEAIDLGFSFVQHHWRALFLPYFLLVLLIAIPVWLLLPENYLWVATLVIWWLKPLFDRLLLHILSHQLFNEASNTAAAFSALPKLLKNTGLLSALTYRRFSLSRSYNLPIWQLEGLRGKELKERKELIYLQNHGQAFWLTTGCVHLEWIVLFSLYALILMLDPTGNAWEHLKGLLRADTDIDTQYGWMLLDFSFYLLTILAIEPFYVAAGFMLYINRRTQLEAWDIEIIFRNLGDRLVELAKASSSLLPSLLAIVVISGLWLQPTQIAHAQYTESKHELLAPERLPPEQAQAQIKEVMALEELNNRRKVNMWLPKNKNEDTKTEGNLPKAFIQLMASIVKAILWIGLVIVLILAIIYRQKILALLSPAKRKTKKPIPPEVLFGLDIRPESLPEDIAGTARKLWQEGYVREALSLLYRGALVILTHEEHLEIHASHTEGDILNLAKSATATERYAYLGTLTKLWQTVAYAHRSPSEHEVEPLLAAWPKFQASRLEPSVPEVST